MDIVIDFLQFVMTRTDESADMHLEWKKIDWKVIWELYLTRIVQMKWAKNGQINLYFFLCSIV